MINRVLIALKIRLCFFFSQNSCIRPAIATCVHKFASSLLQSFVFFAQLINLSAWQIICLVLPNNFALCVLLSRTNWFLPKWQLPLPAASLPPSLPKQLPKWFSFWGFLSHVLFLFFVGSCYRTLSTAPACLSSVYDKYIIDRVHQLNLALTCALLGNEPTATATNCNASKTSWLSSVCPGVFNRA